MRAGMQDAPSKHAGPHGSCAARSELSPGILQALPRRKQRDEESGTLSQEPPGVTFCSYCCFMDRKCWSHCLLTSSSCRERLGVREREKWRKTSSASSLPLHTSFPWCMWHMSRRGCSCCLSVSLLTNSKLFQDIHQCPTLHCLLGKEMSLTVRHKTMQLWSTRL